MDMTRARCCLKDTDTKPAAALALQTLELIDQPLICGRCAHRFRPDAQSSRYQRCADSKLELSSGDHYESLLAAGGKVPTGRCLDKRPVLRAGIRKTRDKQCGAGRSFRTFRSLLYGPLMRRRAT